MSRTTGQTPESLVTPREMERVHGLLRGTVEVTVLNTMLFSDANIKIIQNQIRKAVFDKTTKVIPEQSIDTLLIIIRAIYLEYGRNLPTNISQQIAELNTRVVHYSVKDLISQIKQYEGYIKDASTLPTPLDMPKPTSTTGSRQLQPPAWI